MASVQYNRHGLGSIWLYVFLALMIGNCGIYAIAWQQVIKKFSLSTAYANKSVYLLWSQIWAVVIFHEKSVGTEYYRYPGSSHRRMGGAAL